MATPRRLLVFGGSGFLGVHVVRAALQAGFDVGVAGRTRPEVGIDPASIGFEFCDALAAGHVERAFDAFGPDAVVVCAALSTIADCERYPKLAEELNVEFPSRVAARARDSGSHLVFVSTDLVFGGRPPAADRYTELDEPAPLQHYGRTKWQGEIAVTRACEHALVARLPLLFGDSFGRELGASDALVASVRRAEHPRLFSDEWRTPVDVAAAGKALVACARHRIQGIRHVAGRERLSRVELGERVLVAAGFTPLEARAAIRPTTRAEAGHADRPADVSLASIHDPDTTLT